jgi:hypothetical protein
VSVIEAMADDVGVRAAELARQGDLTKAVRLLVEADRPFAASRLLDAHVVRLTSLARYADVILATEPLPVAEQSLLTRVASLDARRHEVGVTMPEIEAMLAEAAGEGSLQGQELVAWTAAVLVEHLLLEGDLLSVVLAAQHLATLPDDPLPSGLVLQARGRLRRVAALMHLAAGPMGGSAEGKPAPGESEGRAEIDRAIADFRRAGWETERWISISLFYLFRVSQSWSSPPAVTHALTEARDQLLALDSSQVHFARFALLSAAFAQGDVDTLRAEAAELRRFGIRNKGTTTLGHFAEHFDALVSLTWFGGGATALARLARAAEGVRHSHPSMTGAMLVRTTQSLLDVGLADAAAEWYGRVTATAVIRPHDTFEREVVACRLGLLLDPQADVESRLSAALDGLVDVAHPRVTGGLALRAAMSAARAGRPALAESLRARAQAVLPAPGTDRTAWEEYWERSATDPAGPAATPGTARALRVLSPSVEVSVDGVPRRLAPNVARLLVTLAALGRPVGAEELGDALWGDVDPARARGRLKSAIHRLRQALDLEPDELVQRDGDVVRLVPHPRWSVDLHEFHRLAAGTPAERLEALRLVGGVLCSAQFPYDDVLSEERAVLEARWTALAADLLAKGLVEGHEIELRAQRLGVPVPGRFPGDEVP